MKQVETLEQGTIIYWNLGELRNAPRQNRPNRRETFYPVACCECGTIRWLTADKAKQDKPCKSCTGRKGWNALVDKHGYARAVEILVTIARNTQLKTSNPAEDAVAAMLDDLGLEYQTQVVERIDGHWYIYDFLVSRQVYKNSQNFSTQSLVIEVNGGCHILEHRRTRDERLADVREVLFIEADDVLEHPSMIKAQLSTIFS